MRMGSLRRYLRFNHLQMIIAIDDLHHIGRAATFLNVTQSAVSRMLHELEMQIGARLFDRSPRGTMPTAAGEIVVTFARTAMAGLDGVADALDGPGGRDVAHIRIGTAMLAGSPRIADGIARVKRLAPDALVTVAEGMTDDLLDRLRLQDLDVVIARLDAVDPVRQFRTSRLFVEPTVVVARPDGRSLQRAQDWKAATACPWVLAPATSALRHRFKAFLAEQGLQPPADIVEAESWLSVLTLVRQLDALALLPDTVCSYFAAQGLLGRLPIAFDEPEAIVCAIELLKPDRSAAVDRLIVVFRAAV